MFGPRMQSRAGAPLKPKEDPSRFPPHHAQHRRALGPRLGARDDSIRSVRDAHPPPGCFCVCAAVSATLAAELDSIHANMKDLRQKITARLTHIRGYVPGYFGASWGNTARQQITHVPAWLTWSCALRVHVNCIKGGTCGHE
jgi:hypothetical protein